MKILAFSSIRSDYDLMSPLYKLINASPDMEFKLLVSGAHLSSSYGYTVQQIEEDGFHILARLETLLNSDSEMSKLKSASILLQGATERVAEYRPDVILMAGDREDVMMAALMAVFLKIPAIHFYGGDHEEAGHEDTQMRHATSKLASLHFVSCEEHQQRLLSMGESPERIYNIGSIALDKFTAFQANKTPFPFSDYGLADDQQVALVIYHPSPDPKENAASAQVMSHIIHALQNRRLVPFISAPNTDAGNHQLHQLQRNYGNNEGVVWFKNLSREAFLALFSEAECIVGNSSAGLLEAASIPIPAINVGLRQAGRMCGENVVFCDVDQADIEQALDRVLAEAFQSRLSTVQNPYGDGHSADKALKLIQTLPLQDFVQKTEDPLNYA